MEEIREENKEIYWREYQGDILDLLQQLFYFATTLLFSNKNYKTHYRQRTALKKHSEHLNHKKQITTTDKERLS
jgi:hypothetical protein